ncbi:FBD, F-box and Leucine Rich Repeat domains containing protein [Arabidopsis thaliana]|nr:FBD, F-box and Leucine Rich Repeat domains containing protein [Arabidopsis thaliana]AED96216.1 FBD, F-box and Leucine Rich Repeat domains containing protein [Arabidopsis thaliana]|eukprot:NP_200059.2 FBD, F-box and Leucine Rich Repeat domains containing protein [Arabidopsis thaliana]
MAERCQRIDEEVVASRDEISSLPDDLLIQILLLVPIKDAVGTMILSKRWRYVWTLLPKLEYSDPGDECESVDVGKLVANAVDRFVRKLELELHWTAEPTSLPKSLYTCKTLVELTLSDKIIVDVPSSVCLPSLNILRLFYVVFKDENSLERLISSCSVLARSKVGLAISDNRDYRFAKVHKLRLEKPHIDVVCHTDDKFLKAISLVTYLVLPLEDPMALDFRGFTFTRLGKLVICPHGHLWLDIIPLILNNSPKLRFLAITSVMDIDPEISHCHGTNQGTVPRCLSAHLDEEFVWHGYRGNEEETQLIRYIFANAKCLKKVTVTSIWEHFQSSILKREISTFHLEEREVIETVLKSMPRVSTTSTLVFK